MSILGLCLKVLVVEGCRGAFSSFTYCVNLLLVYLYAVY